MAKKSADGVNKSELIRNYITTHKRAKRSAVVAAMAEQGIEVSAQFVSTVKGNMKKKRGGRRAKAEIAASSDTFSLSTLVQAKRLAEQLGGVAKAKEALDALAKLN